MGSSSFSRTLLPAMVLAFAARAHAQQPYLVADVNPPSAAPIGMPSGLIVQGDALYFNAFSASGNRALVRIGADHVPAVVSAIDGEARSPVATDGRRIFIPTNKTLWASDGTAAGTVPLKTFDGGVEYSYGIVSVGSTVYFSALTSAAGRGLWKSDGSTEGTVLVSPSFPFNTVLLAGGTTHAYLRRSDETHSQLWASDGTAGGTQALGVDWVPGVWDNAIVGDTLYVSVAGNLWRSDGTAGSTSILKSFATTAPPGALTRFGSAVLFGAADAGATGLWRTDGTVAGTALVKAGFAPNRMYDWNGTMLVYTSSAPAVLWKSDGTPAGTVEVAPFSSPDCATATGAAFAALPGFVVVVRRECRDLWRTDGTAAGTSRIAALPVDGLLGEPTAFGGFVYFEVGGGSPTSGLWRTDGTAAGTEQVVGTLGSASSDPAFIGALDDAAFFDAFGPNGGAQAIGLWRTTGTTATTAPVVTERGWFRGEPVFTLPDSFLFSATLNGTDQQALFGVGRTGAVETVAELQRPAAPTFPYAQTATSGRLGLFGARAMPAEPFHLFATDGTHDGTHPVPSAPGYAETIPFSQDIQAVERFRDGFAAVTIGAGVWMTDGRARSTRVSPEELSCRSVKAVGERLFMRCTHPSNPVSQGDLYVNDGTTGSTRLLLAVEPGGDIGPLLFESNGLLFFTYSQSSNRAAIWISDGTVAGTVPLANRAPLPPGLRAFAMAASSGVLYFFGSTPESGGELWSTDGTAAGTYMLRDLEPGPASGLPESDVSFLQGTFLAVPGGLVFAATTTERGTELWRTDGTRAGTVPLPDVAPGSLSSTPNSLTLARGRVFFSANDGVHGREPWALDLATIGVAVGDATVDEGDAGPVTASFAIRLDAPAAAPVVVTYGTSSGTAQSGLDFLPAAGVLTFAPGSTERTVAVTVVGDTSDEADESFALAIVSASGAVAAEPRGTGVVVDDDRPRVTVATASGAEGNVGESSIDFQVRLVTRDGQPTTETATIRAEVVPSVASEADFPALPLTPVPTVTFPAGTASGTSLPLAIRVAGDTLDEPDEAFHLRLDSGNDADVPDPGAITGVVLDDDGAAAAAPVELAHGARVVADLAPPAGGSSDVDFYVLAQQPHASYELVADAVSGDAVPLQMERVASGGQVVQSASPVGTGTGVAMSWLSNGAPGEHVRVSSAACGSTCGTDDTYRLRVYETTLAGVRVNNGGLQRTVVLLQNATDRTIAARIRLWAATGSAAGSSDATVPPHGTAVVDLAALVPDFAGSLTVAHDAAYGALVGKAVTFDPATGFTFETALAPKPR